MVLVLQPAQNSFIGSLLKPKSIFFKRTVENGLSWQIVTTSIAASLVQEVI
jgi:hypothetical protein